MIWATLIIGAILFLIGIATTWLAMNSPVQLQPFTWLGLGLGSALLLFGLGGAIL